jgi:hypothetical protein
MAIGALLSGKGLGIEFCAADVIRRILVNNVQDFRYRVL